MEIKKSQYSKEQGKGFCVCCPICKTVLIRAQKGLDGVIKCSQCGMFVYIVIGDERIVVNKLGDYDLTLDFDKKPE